MVILPPFNFSASGFPASWAGAEVENNNADNNKTMVFMTLNLISFSLVVVSFLELFLVEGILHNNFCMSVTDWLLLPTNLLNRRYHQPA